jgi:hypothetical protein
MKGNESEKMKKRTVGRKEIFFGEMGVSRRLMKKATNVIRRTRRYAIGPRCQCQSSGQRFLERDSGF